MAKIKETRVKIHKWLTNNLSLKEKELREDCEQVPTYYSFKSNASKVRVDSATSPIFILYLSPLQ